MPGCPSRTTLTVVDGLLLHPIMAGISRPSQRIPAVSHRVSLNEVPSPQMVIFLHRTGLCAPNLGAQAGTNWPKVLQRPKASMIKKAPTMANTTGVRQRLPLRAIGDGMYHEGKSPGI